MAVKQKRERAKFCPLIFSSIFLLNQFIFKILIDLMFAGAKFFCLIGTISYNVPGITIVGQFIAFSFQVTFMFEQIYKINNTTSAPNYCYTML